MSKEELNHSRKIFTSEMRELARKLFAQDANLVDVARALGDLRGGRPFLQKQMSSLRANMGMGPMQKTGHTSARRTKNSKKAGKCEYTILASGPGVDATLTVTREQLVAVYRVIAETL